MNSEILKSDIFFVVTTVAVILVTIGLVIICLYIIRILRDIKILSEKTKDEGEQVLDDIHAFREQAKEKGMQFAHFFSFLRSFLGKSSKNTRKTSKKYAKEV